jgi:hypothetical protein
MIYSYQRQVYEKLRRTVAAHKRSREHNMGVKPRFHRLVIGPSGSGKSHIAGLVGRELKWNVLEINTGSWIVLGAKETPTWKGVVEWLIESEGAPRMIILDEIDKIQGHDSWTRYLRAELFDLLDGKVTQHTEDPAFPQALAQRFLQDTLIIGCGAFQEAFDQRPEVGFNGKDQTPSTSRDIAKYLQRELVNRFDSELLILPELAREDYQKMISDIRPHVPSAAYDIIDSIAESKIDDAVANKTSARFVESLLASAFYELSADDIISGHVPHKVEEEDPPVEDDWSVGDTISVPDRQDTIIEDEDLLKRLLHPKD